MKKSHIYIILVIGIAIAIIISTAGDASTYVNFDQAYQMAEAGNKASIHVVGELKKDEHGQVTGLEETPDHVSCTFILVDDQPAHSARHDQIRKNGGDWQVSKRLVHCRQNSVEVSVQIPGTKTEGKSVIFIRHCS
jgi:hypothetical protein